MGVSIQGDLKLAHTAGRDSAESQGAAALSACRASGLHAVQSLSCPRPRSRLPGSMPLGNLLIPSEPASSLAK